MQEKKSEKANLSNKHAILSVKFLDTRKGAIKNFSQARPKLKHTTYTTNNMGQKCEGNCGLWVLNEKIFKKYPENLKKILVTC